MSRGLPIPYQSVLGIVFGKSGGGIAEPKLFWNQFGDRLCVMVFLQTWGVALPNPIFRDDVGRLTPSQASHIWGELV